MRIFEQVLLGLVVTSWCHGFFGPRVGLEHCQASCAANMVKCPWAAVSSSSDPHATSCQGTAWSFVSGVSRQRRAVQHAVGVPHAPRPSLKLAWPWVVYLSILGLLLIIVRGGEARAHSVARLVVHAEMHLGSSGTGFALQARPLSDRPVAWAAL